MTTEPDVPALLGEYVAVIRASADREGKTVEVKQGRLWALIIVDDCNHSVVDRKTGEVHMTDRSGTPWNRSTFGDEKGREPMYDLADPEDRAVLFSRTSSWPLGKRDYKERQARHEARRAAK